MALTVVVQKIVFQGSDAAPAAARMHTLRAPNHSGGSGDKMARDLQSPLIMSSDEEHAAPSTAHSSSWVHAASPASEPASPGGGVASADTVEASIGGSGDSTAAAASTASADSLSRWKSYPISLTAWSYLACTLCMMLSTLYYIPRTSNVADTYVPPQSCIAALAQGAVLASAVNFALLCWAGSLVPPPVVTAFWPAQIPIMVVLCYFVYGDSITIMQGCGAALICCGLGVITALNMRLRAIESDDATVITAAATTAVSTVDAGVSAARGQVYTAADEEQSVARVN
jgi:hypothetical protein